MANVDVGQKTTQNSYGAGTSMIQSDDFCWSCRRNSPAKPTLHCTSCVRSYHMISSCCGSKNLSEDAVCAWKCSVCVAIQKDEERMRTEQIDAKHVKKLLSLLFKHVKSDVYLTHALMTIDYSKVKETVVKRMDLRTIEQNINNLVYKCYEAFLSDIKWIVHNVKVHYRSLFFGEEEALKVVKWLLDMIKEEIYSIRMCDECYIGLVQQNRFDVVCKQPHLLVWAKQKTFPYWPAKLMSVNVATNTVEVRYFGGKHCRAILLPKECYMYSALADRPSLWLGALKNQFHEAHEAIAEADLYIKQLKEVYGTFNLAAANTALNANMLERHLYDTMPKAWIALGKTVIPSPIPKPFAAAVATISRRHSIAARPPRPTTPIPSSRLNSGPVVMRRQPTRPNEMNQHDDGDGNKSNSGIRKVISRRQSIQVDMLNATSTSGTSAAAARGASPFLYTSNKRKINDEPKSTEQINSKSVDGNKTSGQASNRPADDPVFKVPEIPRKVRKLQKNASPKIDPVILANAQVINKMASPEKVSSSSPPPSQRSPAAAKCPSTTDGGSGAVSSPPKILNTKTDGSKAKPNQVTPQFSAPKQTIPMTAMGALLNAVVEKNTRKVTEYVRTSLHGMLNEFWDTTKPTQQLQKLQDQLAAMRSTYGGQIDVLRNQNDTMKRDLDAMNSKYDVQLMKVRETMRENEELADLLSATKSKMAVLSADLRKSISNNSRLTANLDRMSKQNGEWQSMVVKLKASHGNTLNTLKDVEAKIGALNDRNKTLVEKNTGLNMSMQRVTKQYQDLLNQLKDVEIKCNMEKTNAYEQCYQMVNDNKKKQWCVVCQKQGGRYYCSSECEEYFWQQNRQ